jgi:hypothetical protein
MFLPDLLDSFHPNPELQNLSWQRLKSFERDLGLFQLQVLSNQSLRNHSLEFALPSRVLKMASYLRERFQVIALRNLNRQFEQ